MIEDVLSCPMCGARDHHRRFDDVPDFVFNATGEKWAIDQCDRCGSLFIARRPSRDTIGRYYEHYYTHDADAEVQPISGIAVQSSAAKKLANSWRNFRYGSTRSSFGVAGVALAIIFSPLRRWIDAESRHLPAGSARSRRLDVLDIGYGDGRFLRFAAEIGHRAAGVEIDPKAVERARRGSIDVHQGDIDTAAAVWGSDQFDYITMSHVIEHVHDPRHVIGVASRLLRPGGRLWIECPNASALGLAHYGSRWRDLDPPRHLCIPTLGALAQVAANAGLKLERQHRRPFVPFEVYPFSAVASGQSAKAGYRRAIWAEIVAQFRPRQREWLTLTFAKPGG